MYVLHRDEYLFLTKNTIYRDNTIKYNTLYYIIQIYLFILFWYCTDNCLNKKIIYIIIIIHYWPRHPQNFYNSPPYNTAAAYSL